MELMQDTLNRLRSEGYTDKEIKTVLSHMLKGQDNVR